MKKLIMLFFLISYNIANATKQIETHIFNVSVQKPNCFKVNFNVSLQKDFITINDLKAIIKDRLLATIDADFDIQLSFSGNTEFLDKQTIRVASLKNIMALPFQLF